MSQERRLSLDSPVGRITVHATNEQVTKVTWKDLEPMEPDALLREAARQLAAYFDGALNEFALPLAPAGSQFQQSVYAQMQAIPYGQTRTYGELAKALDTFGQPVGQACGSNPIPIIIPCHRVLSANGMGGYSGFGGIETKAVLLKLENAYPFLL